MIITGNASVDFGAGTESSPTNSNPPPRKLRPEGRYHRCFWSPPVLPDDENYARQEALKKYLDSYVEAHSKLAKKPQLITADFMMRTGKDNHGDPAGQRAHRAGRQGAHLQPAGAEYQGTERLRGSARCSIPRPTSTSTWG